MTGKEFNETYLPLDESLFRVAFYLLESEDDARDAVQDLYLKLWDSLGTLDSVHNPKAYSITILRNICMDRIRRLSSHTIAELKDTILSEDDTGRDLEQKEKLKQVIKAMENLSESQRTVLRMRVTENLSYEEISQETGMNALTLRVLLSQARNRLKKAI